MWLKIFHAQASKGFLNAASHPLLAFELLASAMSPSDPTELLLLTLTRRVLSLLAFGVKQEQQLPALCGERLLGRLGRIPWRQHKKAQERNEQRNVQPESELSQGDVLCSVCVCASPRPTHSRGAPCSTGEISTPCASICMAPCSPVTLAVPSGPRAHLLSYGAAKRNQALRFHSVAVWTSLKTHSHRFCLMVLGTKLFAVIKETWKMSWASDFQMEKNLFWDHFHFERWFKGIRGKGRASSELPGMQVQFF